MAGGKAQHTKEMGFLEEKLDLHGNFRSCRSILSFCCGDGRLEREVLRQVRCIYYVDISPSNIESVVKAIEKGDLPEGYPYTSSLQEWDATTHLKKSKVQIRSMNAGTLNRDDKGA